MQGTPTPANLPASFPHLIFGPEGLTLPLVLCLIFNDATENATI